MKEQTAAILSIKDASNMSPKGRRNIAAWIRKQADFFERDFGNMAKGYRARYLYTSK